MDDLTIYLDMDGVIVDLVRATYRMVLAEEHVEDAFMATTEWDSFPKVINSYTPARLYKAGYKPWTMEDVKDLWRLSGAQMWEDFPWTSYGKDLYQMCCEAAPVVLMTTPTREPSSAAGKMQWIQKHIPKDRQRDYSFSPCKYKMAHPNALLIDDGEHNIEAFAKKGGETFLWPGPWNAAGKDGLSMSRAFELLVNKIDRLKQRV